jgi:sigma-B regulation protein RsbU (phosphoserine phosphatase)
MLKLDDFFHLPELPMFLEQLLHDEPGLTVVAGLDPRPLATSPGGVLASGRSAMLRVLLRSFFDTYPGATATVITDDKAFIRIPNHLKRHIKLALVKPGDSYADIITRAMQRRPDMLVIDRLCDQTTSAALDAAHQGMRVVSQVDTIFRGASVAQYLLDLGATTAQLGSLRWVVAVQRLQTLCPVCKQPVAPSDGQQAFLRRYALEHEATLHHAPGCAACGFTGRQHEVTAFDIFHAAAGVPDLFEQPSMLSIEEYLARLAAQGFLPLDDAMHAASDDLRRTYQLLSASERALTDANATLERKLAELEAANRVLQQRTTALISLQEMSHALISSAALDDLVQRVCRLACDLGGADRAILYLTRAEGAAEVLAVSGWDAALVHQQIAPELMCSTNADGQPEVFDDWPPGIPPRHADVEGVALRAGLCIPLVAEGRQVGMMIVHSTRKARFAPGEVALLRSFANQAALSIQRAQLIEQLREKIMQLEAAQAEIVAKERLEHELELARQVQQSVLPRTFPPLPGYTFAACNQPARQVGGDFYDIFTLDASRFGIVIADVSGKGMPAALYMALSRSLLLAEARREPSPREVLINVNRLLRELGDPKMFVTVFYGVVDTAARRLCYARAGHDYPLLLRDGMAYPLGGIGMLLGFFGDDELRLSEEQLDLAAGDKLVLYTDGLMDMLNERDQRFDLEQLTVVIRSHAHEPAEALCSGTFADLAAYQGAAEQYDDMTMLVMAVQ